MYKFIFYLFALIVFFLPVIAQAKTYVVEIKNPLQEDVKGRTVCDESQVPCFMTLEFKNNKGVNDYIDIAMNFDSRTAYFQFMHDRRYLTVTSIGEKSLAVPLQNGEGKAETILFMPNPNDEQSRYDIHAVLKISGGILAKLAISIRTENSN